MHLPPERIANSIKVFGNVCVYAYAIIHGPGLLGRVGNSQEISSLDDQTIENAAWTKRRSLRSLRQGEARFCQFPESSAVITIRARCKRRLASARGIRDNAWMRTIYRKFQLIGQFRRRLAVAAGIFFAAAHQTTSLDAASSVSIELQGEIEPQCELNAVSSQIDLGSIFKSGSKQISFGINCNAPFSYAVMSQSGGLQNGDRALVRAGFTNFVVYSVAVAIQTDGGTIAGACSSAALTPQAPMCSYPDSGNKIAIGQVGSLNLSWSSSDELVAGPYADVLTLSLQPRL